MRAPIDGSHVKNAIAGTLIALAILSWLVFSVLEDRKNHHHLTDTQFTQESLRILDDGLQQFFKDVGRYPTREEGLKALIALPNSRPSGWSGPYVYAWESEPLDRWGDAYIYRCPGKNGKPFDLYSCGPSGIDRGGAGDNILDPDAMK
jgi:general secretion pathway protein G